MTLSDIIALAAVLVIVAGFAYLLGFRDGRRVADALAETLKTRISPFDHDGDGAPGGSLPKAQRPF